MTLHWWRKQIKDNAFVVIEDRTENGTTDWVESDRSLDVLELRPFTRIHKICSALLVVEEPGVTTET